MYHLVVEFSAISFRITIQIWLCMLWSIPDGPSLPVGEQLRGLHELQILHPLPLLRAPLLRLLRPLLAQVLPRVLVVNRTQGRKQRQWKVGNGHLFLFSINY